MDDIQLNVIQRGTFAYSARSYSVMEERAEVDRTTVDHFPFLAP